MIGYKDIEYVMQITPEERANVEALYFNLSGHDQLNPLGYAFLLMACKIVELEKAVKKLEAE